MCRTLSEIYNSAVEKRDEYLELHEINNSSKMSLLNAMTWTVSAAVWTVENVMDVFMVDIASALNNRVNGTSTYYSNALLKYQAGDYLTVSEDGTSFSYSIVDESKRIITKVAYHEEYSEYSKDNKLVLKVAKGEAGDLSQIEADDLVGIQDYINNIKFAGTNIEVVSYKGDILIPKITVYHDGAVTLSQVYTNIEDALNQYIQNLEFDSKVYVTKLIDAIQAADNVIDVYIDPTLNQGFYIASYDLDNNLQEQVAMQRVTSLNSGYLTERNADDPAESDLPSWRDTIILKLNTDE